MTYATQDADLGPRAPKGRYVGRAVHRSEDAHLVQGDTRWTANLVPDGALHLGVVRSPMAHARIDAVDLSAALALEGVVAAYSGADLAPKWVAGLPVAGPEGAYKVPQWPVRQDKVRFVGEPVAVVLATSAAVAEDAVELVDVEYTALEAVSNLDAARRNESLVHEEAGSNVAYSFEGTRAGDLEEAFEQADVVFERTYDIPRLMAVALEPRTTLAEPHGDDGVLVHTSTQVPHRIRDNISTMLGIDRDRIRVVAPDVGGAFGPKLDCYAEDILCAHLALEHQRPVSFVATRTEDFQTTAHGRGMAYGVTIAARSDGTFLGLRIQVTGDCGAFLSRVGANIQMNGNAVGPGCYRWEAFSFDAVGLFTTRVPMAAYRGAGRPEVTFGLERAVDDLAAVLGMDPAEVRRRNFPTADEFPFDSIGGFTFESGDYAQGLETALDVVGYDDWRRQQRGRIESDGPRRLGIGISSYVDRCGTGPGMTEFGSVSVDASGAVRVLSGLGPTGQGAGTSLAQIVADELCVDIGSVDVVFGDTGIVAKGKGTFGSRSMAVGGVAVAEACRAMVESARRAAAHLWDVDVDDVDFRDGSLGIRGDAGRSLTMSEIAAAVARGEVPEMSVLEGTSEFDPSAFTFPSGTHVAVVEVDTETGKVELLQFVGVDDAGRIINPTLLEGQLHGGIAQGIAEALYEEVVYDDAGNLVTSSLIDYLAPTGPDLPNIELRQIVTDGPNTLATKGVGESGTIGAPPAVVNAVVDALRDLGVDDVPMPCTPERVWSTIQTARTGASGGA